MCILHFIRHQTSDIRPTHGDPTHTGIGKRSLLPQTGLTSIQTTPAQERFLLHYTGGKLASNPRLHRNAFCWLSPKSGIHPTYACIGMLSTGFIQDVQAVQLLECESIQR